MGTLLRQSVRQVFISFQARTDRQVGQGPFWNHFESKLEINSLICSSIDYKILIPNLPGRNETLEIEHLYQGLMQRRFRYY